jgi:hypothetical protein
LFVRGLIRMDDQRMEGSAPQAEQLIRDYLNRVALAARDGLDPARRSALLARTRHEIERRCGPPGTVSADEVRRVLAALGTPEQVAGRERARAAGAVPRNGDQPAAARPGRRRWPESPAGPGVVAGAQSADTPGPVLEGRVVGDPKGTGNGATSPARPPRDVAERPPGLLSRLAPRTVVLEPADGEPPALLWELPGKLAGLARRARRIASRQPQEAVAVGLLALAGLIYPFPYWFVGISLWLLGLLLAVASRFWDPRDLLAGLLLPVAGSLFGACMAVWLGGSQPSARAYLDEAGSAATYMFKIGASLGAVYLGWRLTRRRRAPVPPWRRSRTR